MSWTWIITEQLRVDRENEGVRLRIREVEGPLHRTYLAPSSPMCFRSSIYAHRTWADRPEHFLGPDVLTSHYLLLCAPMPLPVTYDCGICPCPQGRSCSNGSGTCSAPSLRRSTSTVQCWSGTPPVPSSTLA